MATMPMLPSLMQLMQQMPSLVGPGGQAPMGLQQVLRPNFGQPSPQAGGGEVPSLPPVASPVPIPAAAPRPAPMAASGPMPGQPGGLFSGADPKNPMIFHAGPTAVPGEPGVGTPTILGGPQGPQAAPTPSVAQAEQQAQGKQSPWAWMRSPQGMSFMFGLSQALAQPRWPGQNPMSTVWNGLQGGFQGLAALRANQMAMQEYYRKAGLDERKMRTEEQQANTQSATQKATAAYQQGELKNSAEKNAIDKTKNQQDAAYQQAMIGKEDKRIQMEEAKYNQQLTEWKDIQARRVKTDEDIAKQKQIENDLRRQQLNIEALRAKNEGRRIDLDYQGDKIQLTVMKTVLDQVNNQMKSEADAAFLNGKPLSSEDMAKRRQELGTQYLGQIADRLKGPRQPAQPAPAQAGGQSPQQQQILTEAEVSKLPKYTLTEADVANLAKQGKQYKVGDQLPIKNGVVFVPGD